MARARTIEYDQKRDFIKNKSTELFSDAGYHATSMSQVAISCGISKGLLYHYYESKEVLLFDILYAHLVELIDAVNACKDPKLDAEEQLGVIILALLDNYHDKDKEHRIQIHELPLLSTERQKILRDMERQIVEPVNDVMLRILSTNDKRDLFAKPGTMTLFGMINWCFLWLRPDGKMSRQEYAKFVTKIFLNGIHSV